MKLSALPAALTVILLSCLFGSCKKEAENVQDPGIVICYFPAYIPFRVITANGEDLLDPAKLPSGTVEISWNSPGGTMQPTRMMPATYYKQGKPDQYYLGMPLTNADNGLTTVFSLGSGGSDTLYIKTAPNSSKPFGVTEISFNGSRVDPKMLFDGAVYGLELIKGTPAK